MLAGLRTRLLLLVLLASVPIFALVLYNGVEQRGAATADVYHRALQLARHVSTTQELLIDGGRQLMQSIEPWPVWRSWDYERCQAAMAEIAQRNRQYASASIARPDGQVFCSSNPDPRPTNLADRAHFRRAVASGEFAIGEYVMARLSDGPILGLAYPGYGAAGDLEFVLLTPLDLRWLERLATEADLPRGASLTIFDSRTLTAFGRYPDPARLMGQRVSGGEVPAALLARGGGVLETAGPEGVRWLYALVPLRDVVPGQSLLAALAIPSAEAFAETDRTLWRNLAALALAVLLALGIVWLSSRLFVLRMVDTLLAATRRMAQGDLRARTGVANGRGELGQLAAAFDQMAERIEDREVALQSELAERRRVEAALQASESRFRGIFEQAAVGITLADSHGRILRANAKFCDIVGRSEQELVGGSFLDLTHPDDRPGNAVLEEQLLDGERQGFSLEKRYLRPGGESIWVHVNVSRLSHGPDGSALRVGVVEDISERKLLEEQLRQSQKMEAVGQLAGGVAHDFNNLLTAICGWSEWLQAQLPADAPLRQPVDEIALAAQRAAALTQQLLAFGRRQILEPQVLDPHTVVAETVRLLGRLIREDIELRPISRPSLGYVRVDPAQLQQVLLNLAVNARDAMPAGGRLTIELSRSELFADDVHRPLDLPPGPYLVLAVSDTGCGIDDVTRARIFEPFFTTKPVGAGTGLGLATAYGIVKQSGGEIEVISEPGRGSVFRVYLPCVQQPSAEAAVIALSSRA